jgi:hypothetical protein
MQSAELAVAVHSKKWSERLDFHPRPPGPKPGALDTELRSVKLALPVGLAPTLFPQTTGCFSIQLRERNGLPSRSPAGEGWWEVLVTLQLVTSSIVLRHPIYSRATGSLPELACRAVARSRQDCVRAVIAAIASLRRGSVALRLASSEGW